MERMREELLAVVDEEDEVVGADTFSAVHRKGLRHRSTSVFIFRNPFLREVLLTMRSRTADDPGRLCAVGGHVSAGEGYEEAARKELGEEAFYRLPLPELSLKRAGKVRIERPENREFCTVFWVVHPGPFRGDPEEVEGLPVFFQLEFLGKDMKKHPEKYTKDTIDLLAFLRPRLPQSRLPARAQAGK